MSKLLVQITGFKEMPQKQGKLLVATFQDETGTMELVWFRGHKWITRQHKTQYTLCDIRKDQLV